MSFPLTHRLTAATPTGTPALSVIDFSIGGLLVEAPEPFEIGSTVHLHLATTDGRLSGTFALRCLHTHPTIGGDRAPHLSALVFAHPLDDAARDALIQLESTGGDEPTPGPRRALRLVGDSRE